MSISSQVHFAKAPAAHHKYFKLIKLICTSGEPMLGKYANLKHLKPNAFCCHSNLKKVSDYRESIRAAWARPLHTQLLRGILS